jgi:hypothetical protein
MARTRRTQEKDVIARIADSGEDALRRLVDLPRRIVGQAVDDADARLHDLAAKVREIDPLYGRVAALERRVDALEKRAPARRRASPRGKPTRTARASPTLQPEPLEQATRQHDPSDDSRAEEGGEQGQARPEGQGERTP